MTERTPVEILDAARRELFGLCDGTRKWRMCVPVNEETDSDVVLGRALDLAEVAVAERDTLQAQVTVLRDSVSAALVDARALRRRFFNESPHLEAIIHNLEAAAALKETEGES